MLHLAGQLLPDAFGRAGRIEQQHGAHERHALRSQDAAKRSAVELVKENSRALRGTLKDELARDTDKFNDADKNLLKFHGSYQQEDRDARKTRRADDRRDDNRALAVRRHLLERRRIRVDQGLLLGLILKGTTDPATARRLGVTPDLCRLGLDILSWQKLKTRLPSQLPLGTRVAHKTGTGARGTTNDVGIFWPPNHKLRPVTITAENDDGDACNVTITAVQQDEPVSGPGSGNTSPDAANCDNSGNASSVDLRGERSGMGTGRYYTIAYTMEDPDYPVEDKAATATLLVPHDQGVAHLGTYVNEGPAFASGATCAP